MIAGLHVHVHAPPELYEELDGVEACLELSSQNVTADAPLLA